MTAPTASPLDAALDQAAAAVLAVAGDRQDLGPARRPELVDVRTTDLHPDPDNPRDDVGDVTELAHSMAAQGLIQPVIARRTASGRLVVVAGHRRLAAAQQLRWLTVPTIVRRDMPPDSVLAAMLVENGQRAGLDPIEEARALHRLKVLGNLSDADLARKVGRSQPTVSGRLALLALPVEEQEALRAKQTTVVAAVHKARVASGKVRQLGVGRAWHFSPDHELARPAEARCRRLQHKPGRRVGGLACGECWESVIRADERTHLHDVAARQGTCPVCGLDSGSAR